MSAAMEEGIDWQTARCTAALVFKIIRGNATLAEVKRPFDLLQPAVSLPAYERRRQPSH